MAELDRLADTLRRRFVVAVNPDHPDLFEGPDLLVGSEGHLIAVFVPSRAETRESDRLVARLALSRLALPEHVVCVLGVNGSPDLYTATNLVGPHFHHVTSLSIMERTIDAALQEDVRGIKRVPLEVRQLVQQRTQFLITISQRELSGNHVAHMAEVPPTHTLRHALAQQVTTSWIPGGRDRLSQFPLLASQALSLRNVLLMFDRQRQAISLHRRLQPYLSPALLFNFNVDSGVPFPAAQMAFVMALSNSPRSGLVDPQKPIRAAAFAGWCFSLRTGAEELTQLCSEVGRWTRRHKL